MNWDGHGGLEIISITWYSTYVVIASLDGEVVKTDQYAQAPVTSTFLSSFLITPCEIVA